MQEFHAWDVFYFRKRADQFFYVMTVGYLKIFHAHSAEYIILSPVFEQCFEMPGQRTRSRVYTHGVVVEYDQHIGIGRTCSMIEGLQRHPGRYRSVAYYGNVILPYTPRFVGQSHAENGRNGRRTMSRAECIVRTFVTSRESRYSAVLPQVQESIPPASEYFVGVSLMADIHTSGSSGVSNT